MKKILVLALALCCVTTMTPSGAVAQESDLLGFSVEAYDAIEFSLTSFDADSVPLVQTGGLTTFTLNPDLITTIWIDDTLIDVETEMPYTLVVVADDIDLDVPVLEVKVGGSGPNQVSSTMSNITAIVDDPTGAVVPEPTTVMLVVGGTILLWRRSSSA